jgi:hypothetical protein
VGGERRTLELPSLQRDPDAILGLDVDQDKRTDLLLLTADKPMTMLLASDGGYRLVDSEQMGQFGLVKAATVENTSVFDVDGNGHPELLMADQNFVRALRYDPAPGAGIGPGWQVVAQMNVRESDASLVALAVAGRRIIAADEEYERLVVFEQASSNSGTWRHIESLGMEQFECSALHCGSFSGDGAPNVLAVNDDGFAVVRPTGRRLALREVATWRTNVDDRIHHELGTGDLNNDGFTDVVALDAGEQMCEVLTFSQAGNLFYAMGFEVFESRLFTAGSGRQYEPSMVVIDDVTGDGADDLILLAHDRVLLYPQMTAPEGAVSP